MQRKQWVVGIMAVVGAACGDEAPPKAQAVMFFGLSGGSDGQCIVNEQFELPTGGNAREGAIRGFAPKDSPRVVNGEARVECTVAAEESGSFEVVFRLSSGVVGNFQGRGSLTAEGGEMAVSFAHSAGVVDQDDCTATVGTVLDGAIHISNLFCPSMGNSRSENINCNGDGAIILENCAN